ncbi:bifunctional Nicalin/Peptidase M28 [Babesia duncani]|uniref:BOS complex subunit NCLN n=1 Tax=Babesia duncani TaxID=323732 RepID=A0AAD9PNP2_9APIC|nr:bifunctional Nicalin/Peptidase M28 [Babesia duncani]
MKRRTCVTWLLSLLLFFDKFVTKINGTVSITVHSIGSFSIGEKTFGFPDTLTRGRFMQISVTNPDIVDSASVLSDDQLEAKLFKVLSKRKSVMFRIQDILSNRVDWLTFKTLLRCPSTAALVIIPQKDKVLVGHNAACNEAPATPFGNANLKPCEENDTTIHQETLMAFYRYLSTLTPLGALAFTEENEEINDAFQGTFSKGGVFGTFTYFSNKAKAPKPLPSFRNVNIHGTLGSNTGKNDPQKLVVCASIDSFSLLESYTSTAPDNSAVIMLLELARILSHVKLDANRNIVFLLTTGALVDYHGAYHFANFYPQIEEVDMILCLDDLTGDDLYIQMSKNPKIGLPLQLHTSLLSHANVSETITTSLDSEFRNFQHEQFIKQKVYSITLTTAKEGQHPALKNNGFHYRFNPKGLATRIANVAKAIAENVTKDELQINVEEIERNVAEWQEELLLPRCACCNEWESSGIIKRIETHLKTLLTDVQRQKFKTTLNNLKFSKNEQASCVIYRTRHSIFDALVLLGSGIYILLVWCIIRRSPHAVVTDITQIINSFSDPNAINRKKLD